MNNLANRKKAEKKPELTEDEKFVLGLQVEVRNRGRGRAVSAETSRGR